MSDAASQAMQSLDEQLKSELAALESLGRRRQLNGQGQPLTLQGKWAILDTNEGSKRLLNLASNDTLGLASHPDLHASLKAVIEQAPGNSTGATASRLVSGHLAAHQNVEDKFAKFKHAQAALLFPTGYMANLAVLTSLAQPGDLIAIDKLVHASLIDAARASGANVRSFPHLETSKLARLLQRHAESAKPIEDAITQTTRPARRLIVTDSVFSMDGDIANLPELLDIANTHQATLIVDEAHATGILGSDGSGLAQAQNVAGQIPVTISTASKALAGLGGIVTGSKHLIDTLINRARSFIYTTGALPMQAALLDAALDHVEQHPKEREYLQQISTRVQNALLDMGWELPQPDQHPVTPIMPLITGDEASALALSNHLKDQGILGIAIRPPTVAPGSSRVRLCLRADLDDADIDHLLQAVESVKSMQK